MLAIDPLRVGEGLPGELEAFAHGVAADEAAAQQFAAGHAVEGAVIGHEAHQGFEVVTVPGVVEGLQQFDAGGGVAIGHGLVS
ncbi:hypothetical protein D3C81_1936290 [compost metagenome]